MPPSDPDTENSQSDSCSDSDSQSESDFSMGKPEAEETEDMEATSNGNDELGNYSHPVCLLCDDFVGMDQFWMHLKVSHKFDIFLLRQKYSMDQISFIKLINFIRREKQNSFPSVESKAQGEDVTGLFVARLLTCSIPVWDSDVYLQPVINEDPVLSYWFDEQENEAQLDEVRSPPRPSSDDIADDAYTDDKDAACQSNVQRLGFDNNKYEEALVEAFENMRVMKEVMNRICGDPDGKSVSNHSVLKRYSESWSKHNKDYFESYDDLQIHITMLNDTRRTEAYQLAILNNSADFQGKVILDVGCGTSILSMFAAKAGASKVYAVDRSKILDLAVEIVRENNFQDIIECRKGTVETIELPEQVDVIISEFMGYFLLFEGMLSSYIDARKKFLRPGGAMYPNKAEIFIMGISETEKYEKNTKMWEDMYGFKMTALRKQKKPVPILEVVEADKCVTRAARVLSLDLLNCEYEDAAFRSNFVLPVTKDASITGILGYFDVGFTMGSLYQNQLSTAPHLPETHWYQTIFPLSDPIEAKKGDKISGMMECRPNLQNPRSLDIRLTLDGETQTYLLD